MKEMTAAGEKIALLYARVSTNRQAETGHSLDSQSSLLVKEAEAQGYRVELVLESGSGRKSSRPRLTEALDRLNSGQAQALFVLDIDRLARSTIHALEIAEQAKRRGWRLVIASLNIDTETPSGKLMLGQLALFAEFESGIISERVKRQHQARRERGEVWGLTQGRRSNLEPKTRRLIVEQHQAGKSIRGIIRELEARDLKTASGHNWHPGSLARILKSPQSKVLIRG
jgi:DNA invertase Pin-like site-specific DNA recombinase